MCTKRGNYQIICLNKTYLWPFYDKNIYNHITQMMTDTEILEATSVLVLMS